MKKLILAAVIIAGIYAESDLNKEVLLQECIDYKGGSDKDCRECFYEVYGYYPQEETINKSTK
jgi:hypothetical protein